MNSDSSPSPAILNAFDAPPGLVCPMMAGPPGNLISGGGISYTTAEPSLSLLFLMRYYDSVGLFWYYD